MAAGVLHRRELLCAVGLLLGAYVFATMCSYALEYYTENGSQFTDARLRGQWSLTAARVPGDWKRSDSVTATGRPPAPLQVVFLGTSTLLFVNEQDAVIVDGFLTRSAGGAVGFHQMALELLLKNRAIVQPNETTIRRVLRAVHLLPTGKTKSDVLTPRVHTLVVMHSHHDHSLDAAVVCRILNCTVVGSASTQNVVRGIAGDAVPMYVLTPNATAQYVPVGDSAHIRLAVLESLHVSLGGVLNWWLGVRSFNPAEDTSASHSQPAANWRISSPLQMPTTLPTFKEGGSLTLCLEVSRPSHLELHVVQGSANYKAGVLAAYFEQVRQREAPRSVRIRSFFVATAGLSKASDAAYGQRYFEHTVGAALHFHASDNVTIDVIPIHWDDFSVPLLLDGDSDSDEANPRAQRLFPGSENDIVLWHALVEEANRARKHSQQEAAPRLKWRWLSVFERASFVTKERE